MKTDTTSPAAIWARRHNAEYRAQRKLERAAPALREALQDLVALADPRERQEYSDPENISRAACTYRKAQRALNQAKETP